MCVFQGIFSLRYIRWHINTCLVRSLTGHTCTRHAPTRRIRIRPNCWRSLNRCCIRGSARRSRLKRRRIMRLRCSRIRLSISTATRGRTMHLALASLREWGLLFQLWLLTHLWGVGLWHTAVKIALRCCWSVGNGWGVLRGRVESACVANIACVIGRLVSGNDGREEHWWLGQLGVGTRSVLTCGITCWLLLLLLLGVLLLVIFVKAFVVLIIIWLFIYIAGAFIGTLNK